ncbi:MAG: hypothetical protein CMH12_08920 [Maritimibacter sp.]|nr:hypothetical protein [Maritimibacter sp.]
MAPTQLHSSEVLDRLSGLLRRVPWENEAMTLSKLDGFVAGLAVGPVDIASHDWLPWVWGDAFLPSFESAELQRTAAQAVVAHHERVATALTDNPEVYEVVLSREPVPGEPVWELWTGGFLLSMQLCPDDWTTHQARTPVRRALDLILELSNLAAGSDPGCLTVMDRNTTVASELSGVVRALNDERPAKGHPDLSGTVVQFVPTSKQRHS